LDVFIKRGKRDIDGKSAKGIILVLYDKACAHRQDPRKPARYRQCINEYAKKEDWDNTLGFQKNTSKHAAQGRGSCRSYR
jgi:hypothetical protein